MSKTCRKCYGAMPKNRKGPDQVCPKCLPKRCPEADKKIAKLLKDLNIVNKICWRCGREFYHGSMDLCPDCDKNMGRSNQPEQTAEAQI